MKMKKKDFVPASQYIQVSTGEVIRILRGKKGWTQEDLAKRSGVNAKNISLLENNRIDIGKNYFFILVVLDCDIGIRCTSNSLLYAFSFIICSLPD